MSDTINALQMLNQPRGNPNLLSMIANPSVVNPAGAIAAGNQAAQQIYDVRAKQGQQLWGQALQQATDPQTGAVDYLKAQRIAAQMGPAAAMVAASNLQNASNIQTQQLQQAGAHLNLMQRTWTSVIRDPSDTNVNAQADALIRAGYPADQVNAERQTVLGISDPEQRRDLAYNRSLTNMDTTDSLNRQLGQTTLTQFGGTTAPTTVIQPSPSGPGGVTVGGGIAHTVSPETYYSPQEQYQGYNAKGQAVPANDPSAVTWTRVARPQGPSMGAPAPGTVSGAPGTGGGVPAPPPPPAGTTLRGGYTPRPTKPAPAATASPQGAPTAVAPPTTAPAATPPPSAVPPVPTPPPSAVTNALLPVPPTPPATVPPLSGNALQALGKTAPPLGTAIGGGMTVMPGGAQGVVVPPGTGSQPRPTPAVVAPPAPATPPPAATAAPSPPAATPPPPAAPSAGVVTSPPTGAEAQTQTNMKAYTDAQAAFTGQQTTAQTMKRALDVLKLISTGKTQDNVNGLLNFLQGNGALPPGATADVANYEEFRKLAVGLMLQKGMLGGGTDLAREMASRSNASEELTNPANRTLLLNDLGKQLQTMAAVQNERQQAGSRGEQFLQHQSDLALNTDPRGFIWDWGLYTPQEQAQIQKDVANDPEAHDRLARAIGMARRLKLSTPTFGVGVPSAQ
jgi:hypothetical protein